VALVTDEYDNPVPEARLRFSATSGGVQPARAVSDARGRALVTWTPGTKGGEQSLSAVVTGTEAKGSFVATVPGSAGTTKTSTARSSTSAAKASTSTKTKSPVRASSPATTKKKPTAPKRG
jgi:hypothetical protein